MCVCEREKRERERKKESESNKMRENEKKNTQKNLQSGRERREFEVEGIHKCFALPQASCEGGDFISEVLR